MKRPITNPRAVLFDLDGVLIDSYWVWFHLINHAARELGYPAVGQDRYFRSWGQSTNADRDSFFPRHSVADVERFYETHYFEHVSHLQVLDGAREIFDELRSRGAKTAVVTNSQRGLALRLVERIGARPDEVVAGGDAPRGKPAPDLLLLACERLGVKPSDAWMVGDSRFDRDAARAADIFFIGVGLDGDRRVSGLKELFGPARGASEELDEALAILNRFGEEYGGRLSNHGPMAAEALVSLGRPDAVVPWVEGYVARLEEPAPPGRLLEPDSWREALGSAERVGDWRSFFERELSESSWTDVLKLWLPRLLPGFAGAACHGSIRTSHAVRGLSKGETVERRRELAHALGYWASSYDVLPGEPSRSGTDRPSLAIEKVATLPERERRGLISDELKNLASVPSFAGVAGLLDLTRDPGEVLDEILSTFARVYLQNAERSVIVFVHAVTGPAAARVFLPFLEPDDQSRAVAYAWQAASALYTAYGRPFDRSFEPLTSEFSPEELSARAAENGDDHAIKLTAACLQAWGRSGDGVFLAAAEDVLRRL